MPTHLFAYGSLVVSAVMEAVTGRSHRHAPARLPGYQRLALVDRIYPGIVATPGAVTSGRVYFDLSDRSLRRADFFEADEYVRESVEVVLEAGASLPAAAYVIAGEHRELTRPEPWDEQAFVEVDLSDYLERTRAWMATFPGADSE